MYQTTYHRPSSVDEAVALFAKGSDSKYLAGGHTLIPVMKMRNWKYFSCNYRSGTCTKGIGFSNIKISGHIEYRAICRSV